MPRLPTNATITVYEKAVSREEYTIADGKSLKYNKKEPLSRNFRILITVLSWQITVIRIQNRNEDFTVNPLWCRGGSFMVFGVQFARKGVQKKGKV